jgi:hypothetical protein
MSKLAIGVIIVIVIIIIVIAASVAMKPAAAATPATTTPAAYTLPAGIVNGNSYRCATDGAIYLVKNNQKQHYANPTTYKAAGSPAFTTVDCGVLASIPSGPEI